MKGAGRILIGTSGWQYDHWKGPFYREDTGAGDMLEYYAERFRTVEVNNSFYGLPGEKTLGQWREGVPGGFTFSVKASRYITHMKKLKDPREPVSKFMERMSVLGNRLGPVLFQLPPRWKLNLDRLRAFTKVLPGGRRYTFEFRDTSWFDKGVYEVLSEGNMAFCIYEIGHRLSPREVTADFVYVRLHGPGEAYEGEYDRKALSGWAGAFSAWSDKGLDVFCYFDNDQRGYAARNALDLKNMLEG